MRRLQVWKNTGLRALLIALWAGFLLNSSAFPQDSAGDTPKLLLTAQRLRRLERDRERQTVRWVNFENRVNTVPDSPERGFELALYYAVTHDEKRGREAVDWALAQKYGSRQVALILDWCRELISPEQNGAACGVGHSIDGRQQGPGERNHETCCSTAIARDQDVQAS